MTSILAIETSGSACSVALATGGEVHQVLEAAPREHARKVLPMVDQVLQHSGLPLSAVDAVAFTRGPGSFTGLRIGFGVVQGLAFGCDLPVIGVSTLQCMAFRGARQLRVPGGLAVPALDARMDQLYWAVYELQEDTLPIPVRDDAVMDVQAVSALLPAQIELALGPGWELLEPDQQRISQVIPTFAPDAEAVARMALDLYHKGRVEDVLSSELAYIRNEVSWKKREKIRTAHD